MVLYMNLPSLIYPLHPLPCLYHPLMSTLIFPQQPLVKNLADNDLFLTLNEKFPHFNALQQDCIGKWIEKQPENYVNTFSNLDDINPKKYNQTKESSINYGERKERKDEDEEEEIFTQLSR